MSETTENTEDDELMIRGLIINDNQDAILGYIGGYVVQRAQTSISIITLGSQTFLADSPPPPSLITPPPYNREGRVSFSCSSASI